MNTEKREFAAHIRINEEGEREVQSIEEHNRAVAEMAEGFAECFGQSDLAYAIGSHHDYGKYSDAFQKRIWDDGPKTDHSTAGAAGFMKAMARVPEETVVTQELLIHKLTRNGAGVIGGYCIAGHHAGLLNGGGRLCKEGTLTGRLLKPCPLPADAASFRLDHVPAVGKMQTTKESQAFAFSFLTRMLFSCLVDADDLDTERFMNFGKERDIPTATVESLCVVLDRYLDKKKFRLSTEGLNGARSRILNQCIETGSRSDRNLFTLTVPTGGGKTISSLAFALHHAVRNHMKRVIYVIPYCSIIDQTVSIFRNILGADHVLAHYSESGQDDAGEEDDPLRLACENWDMPVIVTTSVRFFESLFANRTSACRKLHNIADSVVIFDEAQTIPLSFLKPCVAAIAELVRNYRASCVLCTATQPALETLFEQYSPGMRPTEICRDAADLFPAFRRVSYVQLKEELSDDELAERLGSLDQVLCVVPTRKQAKNVFDRLPEEGSYHLSTLMIPKHRKAVLDEIKERLKNGQACRVVSTSLIEAGVDLDFPTVYRAYTGLESEIQAAGRCNRENHRSAAESKVFLFHPDAKYRMMSAMERPCQVALSVTRGVEEIDSPEVMHRYFEQLYAMSGGDALDSKHVMERIKEDIKSLKCVSFKDIAQDFKLIGDQGWTVFVPFDKEGQELENRMNAEGFQFTKEFFRKAGPYCVNIFERQSNDLSGSLRIAGDKFAVLSVPGLYHVKTGLATEDEGGNAMMS